MSSSLVPESVLKKRKRDEQWAKNRAEILEKDAVKAKENKEIIFKRAEQYITEYRQQVKISVILRKKHGYIII